MPLKTFTSPSSRQPSALRNCHRPAWFAEPNVRFVRSHPSGFHGPSIEQTLNQRQKKSLTMSKSPTNHPTNPSKLVKHSKNKSSYQHSTSQFQTSNWKEKKTKLISTWNGSSPPCCSAVAKFPKVQLKDFWAALVNRVNQWELPIGAGLESMTSPGQSLDESSKEWDLRLKMEPWKSPECCWIKLFLKKTPTMLRKKKKSGPQPPCLCASYMPIPQGSEVSKTTSNNWSSVKTFHPRQRCQVAQKYRCKATADLHLHSLNASRCAGHSPSCLAANISRPLSLVSNVPTKWKPKNSVLYILTIFQCSNKLAPKFPRLSWIAWLTPLQRIFHSLGARNLGTEISFQQAVQQTDVWPSKPLDRQVSVALQGSGWRFLLDTPAAAPSTQPSCLARQVGPCTYQVQVMNHNSVGAQGGFLSRWTS